jgi:hypothetical protein
MPKVRPVAAAVALGALAWCLWCAGDDTAPLPADALATPPTTEPLPATTTATPLPPQPAIMRDGVWWSDQLTARQADPLVADEHEPRSAVLRGRLTVRQQPWIHPAGVEVRLTRSWLDSVLPVESEGAQRAPARDEPTTTTDADGCFALRFLPTADELFFLIDVRGAWQDFQKVPRQPRPGEAWELGDVWLEQRGAIAGTVVTVDGQPLAGVEVRAVDEPLHALASGLDDVQDLRSRGLATWQPDGSMRGGAVPGWVARRDRFLPFPIAVTDHAGRFELRGLRPGRHDLFLQPGSSREQGRHVGTLRRIQVVAGRTTQIPALLATESDQVSVRVVDEDGVGWQRASVAVLHGVHGFGSAPTTTNARGEAWLQFLDTGRSSLLFAYPDGGPWIEVEGMTANRLVVTVPRPRPLTILLFDEGDRALPGGTVRTFADATQFRRRDRALPAAMQPQEREPGRYVGQRPCALVVMASVPGFAPAIAHVPHAADAPEVLSLKLLPMGTMPVHTRDLEGRPIAGAAIRVQVDSNPELRFAGAQWSALADRRVRLGTTDERGELVVPTWPARFSLQATHPDFAPSAGPHLVPIAGSHVDLVMRRPTGIVGTLLLQQRPAPKGFRVRARQYAPEGHELHGNSLLQSQLAVTGDDGTFAFRGLCAGLWDLQPELPGVPTSAGGTTVRTEFRSQRVVLDDGLELHVRLEAEAEPGLPDRLVGTVRRDGLNVAGAVVRVRPVAPPSDDGNERGARRTRYRYRPDTRRGDAERSLQAEFVEATVAFAHRCDTDVVGQFHFASLPAAEAVEVRVELPGDTGLQLVHSEVVPTPGEGQLVRVDVALQSARLLLVCTRDGRPLPDEMLRLSRRDARGRELARRDVLLDGNGAADLFDLPAGEWHVQPRTGFGRVSPDRIELRPGTTTTVDLRLLDR